MSLGEMTLVIIDGTKIRTDNTLRKRSGIHGMGTVTRTFNHPPSESIAPAKSMCAGCYDNFYNNEGASECWSFKSAVVCSKVGYSSIHVANGPDTIMEKTLNCWHGVRK